MSDTNTVLIVEDKYDTNHFHVYSNLGTVCFAFSLHEDDFRDIFGPGAVAECKHKGKVKLDVETRIID